MACRSLARGGPALPALRRSGVALVVSVAAGLLTLVSVGVRPAAATTSTPVMAPNRLTAADLAGWYASTGKTSTASVSIAVLANDFIDEGADEGVSGDVAFAQSMVETGYLTFPSGGQVHAADNNFAGLGAVDGGSHPASFPDAQTGVRAQIQHLRAYGDPTVTAAKLAHPLVDPRFDLVSPKGKAPTWDQFGNGIWASAPNYATAVLTMYGKITAWAAAHSAWAPFASLESFVTQSYQDLLFRAPSPSELLAQEQALSSGEITADQFLSDLVGNEGAKDQQPVARLYQAVFARVADRGGLSYWSRRHHAGMTLVHIAAPFVASAEFQHKFGDLPDIDFVELIYQHVFGREADPSGEAYWYKRLSTHKITRAALLVQFSQSHEYQQALFGVVEAEQVYLGMLLRRPTTLEADTWANDERAGTPRDQLIGPIRTSAAYAARFS